MYLRSHSFGLAYLLFGAILIGAILSGLLTTDTRWMSWHFSRLGEGGMLSASIFNAALFLSAAIVGALGLSLADNIALIYTTKGVNLYRAKIIVGGSFSIVTICLIGLAAFPFDAFPILHNIFGYSMLVTFLFLCALTPKFLPIFSRKFYMYGYGVILLASICYVLFLSLGSITLLTVEFILYTCLYAWLLLFIGGIQKIAATEPNRR